MNELYEITVKDEKVLIPREEKLFKVIIEVSSMCNFSCEMCFIRHRPDKGFMSEQVFYKILEDIGTIDSVRSVSFGGIGEPLFHPEIFNWIRETKERGYLVSLQTNGSLITEKNVESLVRYLDTITFSIDSYPNKNESNIGHESPEKVLRAIKLLSKTRSELSTNLPIINVEIVINANNVRDLPKFPSLLAEVGVSKVLVSHLLPTSEYFEPQTLYSSNSRISEEELADIIDTFKEQCAEHDITYVLPRFDLTAERHCGFIENKSTVIRWDGEVVPCYRFLHDHNEVILGRKKEIKTVSFGNARDSHLWDIWTSEKYRAFRFKVKGFIFPSCIHCPHSSVCSFTRTNERDCLKNSPSCGDCLWAHRLIQCP